MPRVYSLLYTWPEPGMVAEKKAEASGSLGMASKLYDATWGLRITASSPSPPKEEQATMPINVRVKRALRIRFLSSIVLFGDHVSVFVVVFDPAGAALFVVIEFDQKRAVSRVLVDFAGPPVVGIEMNHEVQGVARVAPGVDEGQDAFVVAVVGIGAHVENLKVEVEGLGAFGVVAAGMGVVEAAFAELNLAGVIEGIHREISGVILALLESRADVFAPGRGES